MKHPVLIVMSTVVLILLSLLTGSAILTLASDLFNAPDTASFVVGYLIIGGTACSVVGVITFLIVKCVKKLKIYPYEEEEKSDAK